MRRMVISGVNRGIGEAVCLRFLKAGWLVHGFGRSAPAWSHEWAPAFRFHRRDMTDLTGLAEACAEVPGPVDVLLCNAASFGNLAYHSHDFDHAVFLETLAVNLVAPAVMARELKAALRQSTQGIITFMSTGNASLSGNTEGTMLAYRTSKSALNQLARNLAAEWGGEGLTTVALNPGWVRTTMGGDAALTSVEDAGEDIFHFLTQIANPSLNGAFVNTDGSPLPW